MNNDKKIFFLGGKDLEMETIQNLLSQNNMEFVNGDLSWSNAYIDNYVSQINRKIKEGYIVYGVELLNPNHIRIDSDNFKVIDHHGAFEGEVSSIEQVCKIIGHDELTREEKLIAANDARYIPGMRAMGASEEEITDIRQRDRKAQGVTEEEERQAAIDLDSVIEVFPGLLSIKTTLAHFSPLVDRISQKWNVKRLLVYSESEFTFYGYGKDTVREIADVSKLSFIGDTYYGGGINGFWGGCFRKGQYNDENIKKLHEVCKIENGPYSTHYFLFPFRCTQINLDTFHKDWITEKGKWKRVPLDKENLDSDLYNELNYYYHHLYNILYDSNDDSCVRHYEYRISGIEEYHIQINNITEYNLNIISVNVNFYSTGVGVLSIGVANKYYDQPDNILSINQFGRRLFHPFAYDSICNGEGPKSLKMIFSSDCSIELMNSSTKKANTLSTDLCDLINDLVNRKENKIVPILDDRMFVLSWYKNDRFSFGETEDFRSFKAGQQNNHFWYRYIYVDVSDPSCQNEEMRASLIESATYPRWQGWNTLYGISRYSFVMLTSKSCPPHLLQYFETEYVKMAEMVLVQRASILKYTKVLQERTNTKDEFRNTDDLSSYYEEYIHFLNNYRFTNISAQDQAIELYEMLCSKIHIKEDAGLLDQQFNEVQEFMELYEERVANKEAKAANKEARILNRLAGLAVPIAIISAVFGFLFHDNFGVEKVSDFQLDITSLWTNPGFIWIAVTVLFMIAFGVWFKKKQDK